MMDYGGVGDETWKIRHKVSIGVDLPRRPRVQQPLIKTSGTLQAYYPAEGNRKIKVIPLVFGTGGETRYRPLHCLS